MKTKKAQVVEFEPFRKFAKPFQWSCRGSNPGPNKKQKCLLHVYSAIDCRDQIREQTPKHEPYLLNFALPPELRKNYSGIFRYPLVETEPDGPIEGCLVPTPSVGIKLNLLYSIKQQEHNCLRLLVVLQKSLTGLFTLPDMLTQSFTLLSKPGQPLIVKVLQNYEKLQHLYKFI